MRTSVPLTRPTFELSIEWQSNVEIAVIEVTAMYIVVTVYMGGVDANERTT